MVFGNWGSKNERTFVNNSVKKFIPWVREQVKLYDFYISRYRVAVLVFVLFSLVYTFAFDT